MASLARPTDREQLRQRALRVLLIRLMTAGMLLGGSLLFAPEGPSFTTQSLLWLITTAFGTTVAFAIALQRDAPIAHVASAQVALDLGLVTGLVYLTGGAHSGFGSLYAAVVLVAALLLGPRPTLVVAALALLLYLALSLGIATGWFAPPPDQPLSQYIASTDQLAVAVLRTSVGLLVVGGLAGALSDRLSRARGEADRAARFSDDVVRSIAAGLLTLDRSGRIETANSQAAAVFRAPLSELLGRDVREILPVDFGKERARIDGVATRPDGTRFPVGLTSTPLLGGAGEVLGSLVLFQDLSELVMLREKAERAERLAVLGRLAAGLAHEIRNPLGSISGSVELVRDAGTLGQEDRRLLDLVLEEVTRLNELVGTMLSVGRPSTPELAQVEVGAVAREVVEVARNTASIQIALQIEGDTRAYVDRSQLRQVLWNLLKNAIQFSPRGATVEIRVQRGEAGVVVEVEDHGPGISPGDREHIFDMFFTKRAHGVGVGLALVKQIVDAHGATIDIETEEGGGTVFRLTFLDGTRP